MSENTALFAQCLKSSGLPCFVHFFQNPCTSCALTKTLGFSRLVTNLCALSTFPNDFVLSQKVVLLHLQPPMMTIQACISWPRPLTLSYAKNLRFLLSFLFASFLLSKPRSFFLPKTFSFNIKSTHCLVQLVHFFNNFRIQNSHTFYAKKISNIETPSIYTPSMFNYKGEGPWGD